jgi:hypothetical protein
MPRDYAAEYARRQELAEERGFSSVHEMRSFSAEARSWDGGRELLDLANAAGLGGAFGEAEANAFADFMDSYEPKSMDIEEIKAFIIELGLADDFDDEFFSSQEWYEWLDEISPGGGE